MARKPLTDSPEAAIGRRINELRKLAELTYEELAERLGISPDGVKKLINGESTQGFARLLTLSRALKCTPHEILGVSGSTADPDILQATLEVTFEALGLTPVQAAALGKIIQEVLQAPPLRSASLDPRTSAKVQAELAVRQFLRPKPS